MVVSGAPCRVLVVQGGLAAAESRF